MERIIVFVDEETLMHEELLGGDALAVDTNEEVSNEPGNKGVQAETGRGFY